MGFLSVLGNTFLALVILYFLLFLYHEYLSSQRDVQELALEQQSHIGVTRKENETAIYRNNMTPHGLPLVTGLSVRDGFKIRNGNLKDWWVAIKGQDKEDINKERISINDAKFGTVVLSTGQINAITEKLSRSFKENEKKVIGSVLPIFSYHGFVLALSCFLHNGLTFHHFLELPRFQPEEIDVMICYEDQLNHVLRLNYPLVIVISEDPTKRFDQENVVNWHKLFGDITKIQPTDKFEYQYSKEEDFGFPYRQTQSFSITHSYTHQNFVSGCAAIVKAFPIHHELTSRDSILITQTNDPGQWGKVLAVLIMGGNAILGCVPESVHATIEECKPTILTLDSSYVEQFLEAYKKQSHSSWFEFKVARATHLFSEGIFTTTGQLLSTTYDPLRLTYICTTDSSPKLSSSDLTKFRILTGARAVNERHTVGLLGPILSTQYYDYRIFANDRLHNQGNAAKTLEIKLHEVPGYDINSKQGELCVRGFIIGTPYGEKALNRAKEDGEKVGGEGWCPLKGIRGRFGLDGCFYEG